MVSPPSSYNQGYNQGRGTKFILTKCLNIKSYTTLCKGFMTNKSLRTLPPDVASFVNFPFCDIVTCQRLPQRLAVLSLRCFCLYQPQTQHNAKNLIKIVFPN